MHAGKCLEILKKVSPHPPSGHPLPSERGFWLGCLEKLALTCTSGTISRRRGGFLLEYVGFCYVFEFCDICLEKKFYGADGAVSVFCDYEFGFAFVF